MLTEYLLVILLCRQVIGHSHHLAARGRGVAQFCVQDELWDVDLCVALPMNSKNLTNIALLVSGKFPGNRGWAAVGPGSQMADALMFVFYPSEDGECKYIAV